MLSKKMSTVTPSFTIGISTKVAEMKRQGIDVISLSIGEPDFFTPEKAKEAGKQAIDQNKTKYDAAPGLLELRQAIVEKLKTENGLDYQVSDIVVSSGAKHSITNALMAMLDPGDEVLIPKPYWVSYPEMVKLTGGVPVFVETDKARDFKLTVADLEKVVTDRTKLIFITNPSNPSGAVYTEDELRPVVDYCVANGIYIIADEIYERICYLDSFTSIASLSEEAKAHTIVINGLSKSASMTGWRIGYTASRPEIAKAMGSLQGHLVSHPCTIAQWTAKEALTSCQADTAHMKQAYKARRDQATDILAKMKDVHVVKPDGAFYLFIDLSAYASKVSHGDSFSIAFCNKLLEDYKVAVVPGIAFGLDGFIRVSYAADIEEIKEGLRRIEELLTSL